MGAESDKLLLTLRGRPVVTWSINALERSGVVDSVTVVVSERNLEAIAAILELDATDLPVDLVVGGPRRQDSVGRAVESLVARAPAMVLVHDGARPLATPELLRAVLEAAAEHGAATAGLPLKNACKEVDDRGFVRRSLDRASLVSVQTPQAFRFAVLERAHREGRAQGAVVDDDAELAERIGCAVKVVPGDYRNIKITTPDDLVAAEGHLQPA
ncbi:MAG: 2-C-methyl-D-erythritol 4-phosphate cytidylyltransferase [Candidatus Dormibacteraeota bacterium]|nr:2-C-methyl-D-erythritol 4-phosphate cytidylyltransferase [Candidatus Dormibacteraeota bacterium]